MAWKVAADRSTSDLRRQLRGEVAGLVAVESLGERLERGAGGGLGRSPRVEPGTVLNLSNELVGLHVVLPKIA